MVELIVVTRYANDLQSVATVSPATMMRLGVNEDELVLIRTVAGADNLVQMRAASHIGLFEIQINQVR